MPLYREGSHLSKSLETIEKNVRAIGVTYELVLVDDGSDDDTWTTIKERARSAKEIRGVRLSRNFGKEAAICAGLDAARGDLFVVMDGDLQHPPELIKDMFQTWRSSGANVVEAVKEHRGAEGIFYRISSALFYWLLSRFSGYDLRGASDFKLFDSQVRDAWLRMGEKALFFRGMVAWLGFTREAITFSVADRASGSSAWSLMRLVRLAVNAITSFSSLPLHLITAAGGVFFVFALGLTGRALYLKSVHPEIAQGFTTVIILQLLIGGMMMFGLGVMGEYLAQIYREVKARPRYIVRDLIE
ncbi:MAG: glycosyltransferase family 2 protein [Labilithrix sp.]|nr:glycosyltransferase family 2 protein [Labilithrix sp.]